MSLESRLHTTSNDTNPTFHRTPLPCTALTVTSIFFSTSHPNSLWASTDTAVIKHCEVLFYFILFCSDFFIGSVLLWFFGPNTKQLTFISNNNNIIIAIWYVSSNQDYFLMVLCSCGKLLYKVSTFFFTLVSLIIVLIVFYPKATVLKLRVATLLGLERPLHRGY